MNTIDTLTLKTPFRPASPALALARAFSAEVLKMKRTLALGLTLIAPALMVGMNFMIMMQRGEAALAEVTDVWSFYNRQNLVYWALLMQPLFVTLETALVAQLDHTDDHWKHLFALPIPRWAVYSAKLIMNSLLILISMIFLYGYTILSGLLLRAWKPGLGFEAPLPWQGMLSLTLIAFISAGLVISIHNWVALRWHSFVVACGFGIAMTIAGIGVLNSAAGPYYPWTLTILMIERMMNAQPYLDLLLIGSLGGLLLAVLGFWLIRRRDIL